MNTKKIVLALLAFPFLSFAQKGFVIKGKLTNLKDSTLVFLQNIQGNTIAQDYAKKGAFVIKGNLDNPSLMQLSFIGNKKTIELFIGNENVVITGDATKPKDAIVTGSITQNEYKSFLKGFLPLNEKLAKIGSIINSEKDIKKRDSLMKVYNNTRTSVELEIDQFLKKNPTSPVSTFLLLQFNSLFAERGDLESTYNTFSGNAKKGLFATEIEKILAVSKLGAIGSMATDFTQNDTANIPVSLSSFKGKYVLVDFWASWCGPCRQENPNVVSAYNQFKAKNFTVLGVSLDKQDGRDRWLKAIKDDNLTWTHVSDLQWWQNAAAKQYGIESIPANMLIDPTGKIIGKNLRAEELLDKLKEVLK